MAVRDGYGRLSRGCNALGNAANYGMDSRGMTFGTEVILDFLNYASKVFELVELSCNHNDGSTVRRAIFSSRPDLEPCCKEK